MTEEAKSYIYIEFKEKGSIIRNIKMENVLPLQMLAIAGDLRMTAEGLITVQRLNEIQRSQAGKLIVPAAKGIEIAQK